MYKDWLIKNDKKAARDAKRALIATCHIQPILACLTSIQFNSKIVHYCVEFLQRQLLQLVIKGLDYIVRSEAYLLNVWLVELNSRWNKGTLLLVYTLFS